MKQKSKILRLLISTVIVGLYTVCFVTWTNASAYENTVLIINNEYEEGSYITGITQIRAEKTKVSLTWDSYMNCERYRVRYSMDKKNWGYTDFMSETSTQLSRLTAGKSYYVEVEGYTYDKYRVGSQTYVSEYKLLAKTEEPVELVTIPNQDNIKISVKDATTNSLSFEVSGVIGANVYTVYLGYNVNLMQVYRVFESDNFTVDGLEPSHQYTFTVVSGRKSSTGYEARHSTTYYGEITCKTLPGKLTEFHAQEKSYYKMYPFEIVERKESVSHGVTKNVFDGYELQLATLDGKTSKSFNNNAPSFSVSGELIDGKFWSYRVRAYILEDGKKKYGEWSDKKFVSGFKKINAKVTKSKISLGWTAVKGAKKYSVYISDTEGVNYKKVKEVTGDKYTIDKFNKKKLKKGKTYYIRIKINSTYKGKKVESDVPYDMSVTLKR